MALFVVPYLHTVLCYYEWLCVVRRSRESLPDCFVQHSYSLATFILNQNAIVVSNFYDYHQEFIK